MSWSVTLYSSQLVRPSSPPLSWNDVMTGFSCTWFLLAALTALEVILFQQVFVNQLIDLIELQALQGVHSSTSATLLLTLLSVTNLVTSMLHLLSTYSAGSTSKTGERSGVCAAQWGLTRTLVSCWCILKVTFAGSLLAVLVTNKAGLGEEGGRLLLIMASSCAFLWASHRLTSDLALLAATEEQEGGKGSVAYSLVSSGPPGLQHSRTSIAV